MAEAQLVKPLAPGETCPACGLTKPSNLTRADRAVADYFISNPHDTQQAAAQATNIHYNTVSLALKKSEVQSLIREGRQAQSDKALGIAGIVKHLVDAQPAELEGLSYPQRLGAASLLSQTVANCAKAGIELEQGESAELEDGRGMLTRLVAAAYERCEAGLPPPDNPLDLLLGKAQGKDFG